MSIAGVQQSGKMDMLHGRLWGKILLFALPIAASSLLQQVFNSVDMAVVGRFASSQALAAVGSNAAVIGLMINIFVGLSVGANVVIASYLGQGDEERVSRAVHTVMLLAVASGLLLIVVGTLAARPILTLMGTPHDVIEMAVVYLRIYFAGMPFMMTFNFGAAVLRSCGDTRRPMYCLILSGLINIGLNLLLVIVFHLGVVGVAVATDVSQLVSAFMIVMMLMHEEGPLRLVPSKLRFARAELLRVVRIGVPAGVQAAMFSISNICIQAVMNLFGSSAVAGSVAAFNYEVYIYFVVTSFCQAAVTFMSQNYGAMNYDRCHRVFRICYAYGIFAGAVMSAVFVGFKGFFMQLFTTDPAALEYAALRMMIVVSLEWMTGTYEIAASALRGIGWSITPSLITVFGTCAFRLFWAFVICSMYPSFTTLMMVYPISWAITGTAMFTAYIIAKRRLQQSA